MDRAKPGDLNENGIPDEIEPPIRDISAGSQQIEDYADRTRKPE